MASSTGIKGIDHAAVLVADLAEAEAAYRRLGFRTTPIGHHDKVGTANHCIMLEADYFELMGVITPTPFNKQWADAISEREGLWGLALKTDDIRASHAGLKAAGFAPTAPADFSRPVDIGGQRFEARFTLTYLEPTAVQGIRLFVCQHHTRDLVWRPDCFGQPNAAVALAIVTLSVDDPATAASAYGRIFGTTPVTCPGGIEISAGRATIRLLSPAQAAVQFADDPVLRSRRPIPIGLGFKVSDRRAARAALNNAGIPYQPSAEGGFRVGSAYANGVVVDLM